MKTRAALAMLLLSGCAGLEARPPLEPLAARPASGQPEPTPGPIAPPELVKADLSTDHREGSYDVVRAIRPGNRYVSVSFTFPKHASPKVQRVTGLLLHLAYQRLDAALPAGARALSFDRGTGVQLGFVTLPSKVEACFEALAELLKDPSPAFEDYTTKRRDFLQDLVSSSWSTLGLNLVRMGRFGAEHRWAEGAATQVRAIAKVREARARERWDRLFDLSRGTLVMAGGPGHLPPLEQIRSTLPAPGASSTEEAPEKLEVPPARTDGGMRFHALWFDDEQVRVQAYHVGPAPTHPDYPAFRAIAQLLDGGFRGEGNRSLRHEKGATYGVGSEFSVGRDFSELLWGGPIQPEQALELMLVHEEMTTRLRIGEVSQAEVDSALASLRTQRATRLEDPESLVQKLADCASAGVPTTYEACLAPEADGVSKDDVVRVARTYLEPINLEWLFMGEMGTIKSRLQFMGTLIFYKREKAE